METAYKFGLIATALHQAVDLLEVKVCRAYQAGDDEAFYAFKTALEATRSALDCVLICPVKDQF